MEDSYYTIEKPAEAIYKEKSSKFLVYAYPVRSEEQIKEHLDALRKIHYDATHHCYAWRLGAKGELFRANDDGEPSGTAGKPIHGQLLSNALTYCLVVVVRYFGGTKLGVGGLISAYKESTAEVIKECTIIEQTVDVRFRIDFSYMVMNDVMKIIKDEQPQIDSQTFDNLCTMNLSMRKSRADAVIGKFNKVMGLTLEIEE